jgi:hypothetical protein
MGLKKVLSTAKDCGAVIKWAVISRTCLLVLQVRNQFCPEVIGGHWPWMNFQCSMCTVSFPEPHPQEGKGLGTLKHFLDLVYHYVIAHAPIQTYTNNHMIAGWTCRQNQHQCPQTLFSRVHGGVWEWDYFLCCDPVLTCYTVNSGY